MRYRHLPLLHASPPPHWPVRGGRTHWPTAPSPRPASPPRGSASGGAAARGCRWPRSPRPPSRLGSPPGAPPATADPPAQLAPTAHPRTICATPRLSLLPVTLTGSRLRYTSKSPVLGLRRSLPGHGLPPYVAW